jgi:hypothetical protein
MKAPKKIAIKYLSKCKKIIELKNTAIKIKMPPPRGTGLV